MNEYSRIIIEEYCRKHISEKSRQLKRLLEMSYDLGCIPDDSDAVFLESVIMREKDPDLKKALMDMDDYLFNW